MPTPDTWPSMPLKHADLERLSPLPPTPKGFRVRTWQDGDELTVPPVLGDAFDDPEMSVYEAQLKNWHGKAGVSPESCFAVETTQGVPVATAIGRIDPAEPQVGRLHQVAVRRAYWRRGLGSLTVYSALHYIREHQRKVAVVGWEWDALLFYLSLGFRPVTAREDLLVEDEAALPWETARAWADVYQLFRQTNPKQLHLLEPPAADATALSPPPVAVDVWVDDFMVDDDGDLKLTRASINDPVQRVSFAGEEMTAEGFLGTLNALPADPEKPVFLRMIDSEPSSFGRDVRSRLWSAGYLLAGLVGPRSEG